MPQPATTEWADVDVREIRVEPGADPWLRKYVMVLAERVGMLISQIAEGRTQTIGIRYYGPLVAEHADLIASSVVVGVLRPMLSSNVTVVNARETLIAWYQRRGYRNTGKIQPFPADTKFGVVKNDPIKLVVLEKEV